MQLLVSGSPCLFKGRNLVLGPCLEELVYGSDVVNDDLISRVEIAFAMQVIRAVKESSLVMSKVFALVWFCVLELVPALRCPIAQLVECLLDGVST